MKPIWGFSSTTSQSCQPNCAGNSEMHDGDWWRKKKGCSSTNATFSVSEQNAWQVSYTAPPHSCRTIADIGNYSGFCSLGWSPLELTGALSGNTATKAISISSLHQDDNTHLLFCLMESQSVTFSQHCDEMPTKASKDQDLTGIKRDLGVEISLISRQVWNEVSVNKHLQGIYSCF